MRRTASRSTLTRAFASCPSRTPRASARCSRAFSRPEEPLPQSRCPGYVLAGKTGTAQKVVDGEYSETDYVGSFVGFAPAEDPRLLVTVVVDSPTSGSYYGGDVAAPAFGEIANFALPYLDVPPDR